MRVINCSSNDGRYSRCFARTEGEVSLRKQISSTPCVLRRNWGYDGNGVWVDNGCRGEFVVGRGGPGSGWGAYPGTWPGPGGTVGGSLVQRAASACRAETMSRGYQDVSVDNANQNGSTVYVYLRAYRNSREYSVGCQYASSSKRARITTEDLVVSGGGGGNVAQRGRDACSNKASTMGYQSVYVTSSRQSGSKVTVTMTARSQNRPWNLTCIYRQSDGTATLTDQRQAGN